MQTTIARMRRQLAELESAQASSQARREEEEAQDRAGEEENNFLPDEDQDLSEEAEAEPDDEDEDGTYEPPPKPPRIHVHDIDSFQATIDRLSSSFGTPTRSSPPALQRPDSLQLSSTQSTPRTSSETPPQSYRSTTRVLLQRTPGALSTIVPNPGRSSSAAPMSDASDSLLEEAVRRVASGRKSRSAAALLKDDELTLLNTSVMTAASFRVQYFENPYMLRSEFRQPMQEAANAYYLSMKASGTPLSEALLDQLHRKFKDARNHARGDVEKWVPAVYDVSSDEKVRHLLDEKRYAVAEGVREVRLVLC